MGWTEAIALTLAAVAACALLHPAGRPHRRGLALLAAGALAFELLYRGPAVQVAPLLLAVVFLRVSSLLCAGRTQRTRPFLCGCAALALVSTSLGLLIALPFFRLPEPTGRFPVGTRTVTFIDETRTLPGDPVTAATPPGQRRALVTQVWYPAVLDRAGTSLARYVRLREVKPLFWYMAGIRANAREDAPFAAAASPAPVLLFGPSWNSRRTIDTFLAEELASHGYVVVALDHPLNAARLQLADGQVLRGDRAHALDTEGAASAATIEATWAAELDRWTADDQAVLLALAQNGPGNPFAWLSGKPAGQLSGQPGGQLSAHLDLGRVGAFGHSFGGASSIALLGPRPAHAGIPAVRAAANMDGWTFRALDHRTTEPLLLLYGGPPPSEGAPSSPGVEGTLDRDDVAAIDASLRRPGGRRVDRIYLRGATHLDFTDGTLFSPLRRLTSTGPIGGERARTLTRALVLAFFDRTLRGSIAPMPSFPEAVRAP